MTVLSNNNINTTTINNNYKISDDLLIKNIKIGFVSSSDYPILCEDDRILFQLCKSNNIQYKCVVWDDENMNGQWNTDNFDILIIRSLWDYVFKVDKFFEWMEIIKENGIKVLNDLDAIKWNLDKNYLQELQVSSLMKIKVVPSVYIRKGDQYPIHSIDRAINDAKQSGLFKNDQIGFVYKPTIGANGYGTTRFNINELLLNNAQQELNNEILTTLLKSSDVIIQPFINSIKEEGETSFIFFNGKFSHSIIKKPCTDDFRVQEDHGGTVSKNLDPNYLEIQSAQTIVDKIIEKNGPILYARIDMLRINGTLYLSESEIFEPTLYFMGDTKVAKRFLTSVFELI